MIPFCPCVYHWVFCIFQGSESFSSSMKAAGLPELPPGMVHPAFLHPMMRPSVPIPQSGYFPIPLQLQQLYQAQLRASAAYDGLLQRDHASFSGVPLPMFVPQMPLYSQRDKKWPAVQSLSTILYSYLIWSFGLPQCNYWSIFLNIFSEYWFWCRSYGILVHVYCVFNVQGWNFLWMIPLQFKKTHQIMRNSKSVHLRGRCRILSRAVGGTGSNGIYILLLTLSTVFKVEMCMLIFHMMLIACFCFLFIKLFLMICYYKWLS